jgi:aminoglycoside phosphotransferase (APT) family kinase protein
VSSLADVDVAPARELVAAVERLLPDAGPFRWHALTGGVSSDIWRIEGPKGVFCVKRALPRLKVAADWFAPVERNREEVKWLRFAATVIPGHVPRVIASDAASGVAVLEWLDPAAWQTWKSQLLEGQVRAGLGSDLGRLLATVHNASAADPTVARDFDNLALFDALRLEPYFGETARRHPDLAHVLDGVRHSVAGHRTALVHGDVSPKNILVNPGRGPVLLDAECACWADPAFDVAFLASHLCLKAAHMNPYRLWYHETLRRFFETYARIARESVDARTPILVVALMLARIDGKSPVEYLTPETRLQLRAWTRAALAAPLPTCEAFLAAWKEDFSR